MIYIVEEYDDLSSHSYITSVWDTEYEDVESKYSEFLTVHARTEFNLVINSHWHNAMNWKHHNEHLTEEEHHAICKKWRKELESKTIEWFLEYKLKARRLEYKTL